MGVAEPGSAPDPSVGVDQAVLPRPHLVERVLAHPVGAAVAPGGFGKTTLVGQAAVAAGAPALDVVITRDADAATLVWLLARAARRRGRAGLAGALMAAAGAEPVDVDAVAALLEASGDGDGLTVTLDEVGELVEADAVELVRTLVTAALERRRTRVLLCGRSLPAPLVDLLPAEPLGAAALALTEDEVAALLRRRGATSQPAAHALWADSRGWPAGVALALAGGSPPGEPDDGVIDVVVRGSGARTVLRLPRRLAPLVDLPLLSPELVVAAAGRAAWRGLADAGVPRRDRGDGWWVVPDPVRDAVTAAAGPVPLDVARTAATSYADDGMLPEAVALLLQRGDELGTGALVAARPWTALDDLPGGELRALVEALGDDAVRAHPRALLHLAWAADHQAEVVLVEACLDRLERVAEADDRSLALLVDAERARAAVRHADVERAIALAERVRAATPLVGGDRDLAAARGRATHAMAIALLYDVTPDTLRRGESLLSEATGLLRLAGVPRWESQAWLGLGFGVDLNAGRFARAVERIGRGLALLPQQDAARARMLTFLVEVLSHLPRLDEAEAAGLEAVGIAERYADRHLSAYAHWSLAWVSTRRRDLPRVRARLERVELDLADWYDLPAGVLFHADAAEMLGDCGDADGAAEHLRRGRARADVTGREELLVLPSTLWEARYGDARAASDRIAGMTARPRERWRYALVQAWCAHRLGDDVSARTLIERSLAAAEALGHPETVAVVEPELAAWAVTLLGSAAGAATAGGEPRGPAEVVLLGPVRVHRGTTDVTPPPGHPTELLALLAQRGALAADTVAETLWPEADTVTARRRLRNLLHRLRAASGDLVARDREDRLVLARDVEVDLVRLRSTVAAVLAAPAPERAGAARAALRLVDRLEPPGGHGALFAAREEGLRLALTLLDLVVEAAVDADDLDDAAALARRACALDPADERRLLLLASILRDAGRLPAAREALVASLRRCREMGVEPTVSHRALAAGLGVPVADAVAAGPTG